VNLEEAARIAVLVGKQLGISLTLTPGYGPYDPGHQAKLLRIGKDAWGLEIKIEVLDNESVEHIKFLIAHEACHAAVTRLNETDAMDCASKLLKGEK